MLLYYKLLSISLLSYISLYNNLSVMIISLYDTHVTLQASLHVRAITDFCDSRILFTHTKSFIHQFFFLPNRFTLQKKNEEVPKHV